MEENQITTPVEETPTEVVNESAQNETAEKAVQEGTVYVTPAQAATVYTPSAQTEPKQIHVAALVMGILSIVFSLLFAIVGDVNSHAHLFPWIGLFVDLHNAAFKHVGMAETQQLRDGGVAIAGDVAKMHTLAVNCHGIGVVRVVGFGYEFELLAGLEFLERQRAIVILKPRDKERLHDF